MYNKGHFWFPFLNIGCIGLNFLVHTFINQFLNIFRVPVISVNSWTWFILLPLSKKNVLRLPSPLKNCNFWLNILPLDFWFFKCSYCQILFITIVTMSLYLTVSRDNAGLMEILLISRISEFSYLQKGEVIHVPCISISIITVRSSLF